MASLPTAACPPLFVMHRKHSEHRLTLEPMGHAKFECNGCHQHGTGATGATGGNKYTCPQPGCCFNLHEDCALTELGARFVHKLLKNTTFEFSEAPSSKKERRLCDACGARVLGFHYHCSKEDLDLHPCCAKLPPVIQKGELTFELRKEATHRCKMCKEGGGVGDFWFYRSTCTTVYLHVRCMTDFFLPSSSSSSSTGPDVHDDGRLVRYVEVITGKAGRNFDAICEVVKVVVGIILAVITGNPLPLIPAVIDVVRNCGKMKIR